MQTYSDYASDESIRLWMDISTYCNAACPQCHRTNPNGLGKQSFLPLIQWSKEQFAKAFSPESMNKIAEFDFCGTWGDPVMNRDIFEICQYIIENSEKTMIHIHTNGSIRDETWWWKLGMMCGDRLNVVFAIDGTDQETHSFYRQGTDLELIIANAEALAETESSVETFTVLFKHNDDMVKDIQDLARSIGARRAYFTKSNRFHNKRNSDGYEFFKDKEQYMFYPSNAEKEFWGVTLNASG